MFHTDMKQKIRNLTEKMSLVIVFLDSKVSVVFEQAARFWTLYWIKTPTIHIFILFHQDLKQGTTN